jgi:hypothetical protein
MPSMPADSTMSSCEEWTPTGPPLTIEALYDQGPHRYFQYNDRLYLGFLQPETAAKGQELLYGAIDTVAGTSAWFPGSTVVTPVTSELPPYSPAP